MDTNEKFTPRDKKSILSTLWIFILFNMIFRDIHEFGRSGFIEEMMTGSINGVQLSEELFLFGGILAEVPIAMMLLARILPYRFNRWANIIVALFMIAFSLLNGTNDLDDIWFLAIEIAALIGIIGYAWRWTEQKSNLVTSLT